MWSRALLWLFVLNLGIAFGAGLYEHRIVVPTWISSSPELGAHWNANAVRETNTGRRFWVFVTTVPLTMLTLANLGAAWRERGPVRQWWLTAALVALAERLITFSYFIPAMVALTGAPDSPESVARAVLWSNLNFLRHGLGLAAWILALQAFWKVAESRSLTPAGKQRGSHLPQLLR
jgi:hypothetical protein